MEEDVALGREVVADGRLLKLRERLGLTRNAMAELLHTSTLTYSSWENRGEIKLWPATASRVGRFYRAANTELELLTRDQINIENLIPLHMVATQLGIPQEMMLRMYRDETVNAVDAGILGLWCSQVEVDRLRNSRCL